MTDKERQMCMYINTQPKPWLLFIHHVSREGQKSSQYTCIQSCLVVQLMYHVHCTTCTCVYLFYVNIYINTCTENIKGTLWPRLRYTCINQDCVYTDEYLITHTGICTCMCKAMSHHDMEVYSRFPHHGQVEDQQAEGHQYGQRDKHITCYDESIIQVLGVRLPLVPRWETTYMWWPGKNYTHSSEVVTANICIHTIKTREIASGPYTGGRGFRQTLGNYVIGSIDITSVKNISLKC